MRFELMMFFFRKKTRSSKKEINIGTIKQKRCRRKSNGKEYFCFLCNLGKPVMNAKQLTDHFSFNHPGNRIIYRKVELYSKLSHVCDICGMLFDTIMDAEEHISQHEIQHTCTYCNMTFKKTLEYAMHVYDHTNVAKCELCTATFARRLNLQNHYSLHLNSMRPFICDLPNCDRRFMGFNLLRDHKKRHIGERSYNCSICLKNFITHNDLKSHMNISHPKTGDKEQDDYECKECNIKYKYIVSYKRHLNSVHSDKKHVCDKCGKEFSALCNLRQHAKYHEDKQLQCQYCDRKFHLKKGLKAHELTHTGEKRYPCRYCDKRFARSSVRATHERLHTNERPYCCNFCGKGYTSRAARHSHQQNCKG